jgi:hypothetical protein
MIAISEKLSDVWEGVLYEAKTAPLVLWLMLALLMGFIGFLVLYLTQPYTPIEITGYLVGKEYSPSTLKSNVGTGIGSDGKPITIVTTSGESEKWTVILLVESEYKTYKVSPEIFYSLPENQNVTLYCMSGNWIPSIHC